MKTDSNRRVLGQESGVARRQNTAGMQENCGLAQPRPFLGRAGWIPTRLRGTQSLGSLFVNHRNGDIVLHPTLPARPSSAALVLCFSSYSNYVCFSVQGGHTCCLHQVVVVKDHLNDAAAGCPTWMHTKDSDRGARWEKE